MKCCVRNEKWATSEDSKKVGREERKIRFRRAFFGGEVKSDGGSRRQTAVGRTVCRWVVLFSWLKSAEHANKRDSQDGPLDGWMDG